MERTPITRSGFERLNAELRHLKTVERPQVIQAIEEARAHGDLSENAEFDAANPHALEPGHFQSDLFTHAANLTLSPFAQHEAQLIFVEPRYFRGF